MADFDWMRKDLEKPYISRYHYFFGVVSAVVEDEKQSPDEKIERLRRAITVFKKFEEESING